MPTRRSARVGAFSRVRRGWCALGSACALAALLSTGSVALGAQEPSAGSVAAELEWRVEELRSRGWLWIGQEAVSSEEGTLAVYEARGFAPLWTNPLASESLLRMVEEAYEHGLEPEDYHLSALSEAGARPWTPAAAAERDLLRTDALVRLSHDLRFGKVRPRDREARAAGPDEAGAGDSWRLDGPPTVPWLVAVVERDRIRSTLSDLAPRHFLYRSLKDALAELRKVQSEGGWESLPSGPTLSLGSVDARVPALRRRLTTAGVLAAEPADASVRFDATLEAAVRAFQRMHGLDPDGRVGPSTLAALNVPLAARIDQLRVNLERARWTVPEFSEISVAVNVAAARVRVLSGDVVLFDRRAIVGKRSSPTPSFTATMTYVELNPTWTVPPGIVGEVLARVQREPEYLQGQGMQVLDRAGRPVDPNQVDFSRYTAAEFPYVFRQAPGPLNPLGRLKLMFPNEHDVYIHDTPSRHLFEQETRLLSHGCVRVEDPIGLAEIVLGRSGSWDRAALTAAIESGPTRTISLPRPLPVFVTYWTAAAEADGSVRFYNDVYGRDAALLAALDGDPGREAPHR